MLKTQAWKICCVRGSVKRRGEQKETGLHLRFHVKERGRKDRSVRVKDRVVKE